MPKGSFSDVVLMFFNARFAFAMDSSVLQTDLHLIHGLCFWGGGEVVPIPSLLPMGATRSAGWFFAPWQLTNDHIQIQASSHPPPKGICRSNMRSLFRIAG